MNHLRNPIPRATAPRGVFRRSGVAAVVALAATLSPWVASAQDIRDLQPGGPRPAPLVARSAYGNDGTDAGSSDATVVDLGRVDAGQARPAGSAAAGTPNPASGAQGSVGTHGTAARAAQAAQASNGVRTTSRARAGASLPLGTPAIERAVFNRQPVRAALPVGRERLITLPSPAVLHVPDDIAAIARIESIDKTLYLTALTAFTPVRVVAELIDGGQQIPIDLVANAGTAAAAPELEIHLVAGTDAGAAGDDDQASVAGGEPAPAPPDMVALTRFAARQLYAPRRLAYGLQGVQQVDVTTEEQPALMRGVNVRSVPLAQWRAGKLYVTAVQVTNRSRRPVELPTDDLRGHWVSVTSQHGRLGPAGTETDTTALYLVCDRPFEACR